MLTREDALNLIEIALRYSKADQTEIILMDTDYSLTRLANGGINQNVSIRNMEARVRAVVGRRVGVAISNRLAADDLRSLVDRATAMAKVSEPNPEFVSLPSIVGPGPAGLAGMTPVPAPEFDAERFSPERRADAAATMVQTAVGNGVTAAGHVSTSMTAIAVGNSLGVRAYHAWPQSGVMAIMTRDGVSGYADWAGTEFLPGTIDTVAGRAAKKCLAAKEPTTVPAGTYTVVLEPPAVAEMLSMLALMGLGATAYQEERSFMTGKLGEQLVGENISLRDDAYHPGMIVMPFDYEGTPKQVVPFFDRGVAREVVHDSFTAQKAGRESTGHALPAPNSNGPIPLHLVLDGKDHTKERLIRDIERGILVTRFHYVNIVHPKETTITGMTRDGTFLIENGSVTRAINNLRFTQSVLEALRHVSGIEREQTLINQEGIYCLVPSLRIDDFFFTS